MRISGVGPNRSTSSTKKTEKSKGGDGEFAKHVKDAAGGGGESRSVDTASAVSGLDALLAMQSVDPDAGNGRANQRMAQRGEDLLDLLEEIRHGLLLGHIPKDRLANLAQVVRAKRDAGTDPRINAILDEIELRAEVELAKLTRR